MRVGRTIPVVPWTKSLIARPSALQLINVYLPNQFYYHT